MEDPKQDPKDVVEEYEAPQIIEMGKAEDLTQGGCRSDFENNKTRSLCNASDA